LILKVYAFGLSVRTEELYIKLMSRGRFKTIEIGVMECGIDEADMECLGERAKP